MSDKVFYDIKAFIETGKDGKKKVVNCGYLYENGKGGFSIKLQSIPTAGWDGSLLAEIPKPKAEGDRGGNADFPFGT
jgi:hypothetical protein